MHQTNLAAFTSDDMTGFKMGQRAKQINESKKEVK